MTTLGGSAPSGRSNFPAKDDLDKIELLPNLEELKMTPFEKHHGRKPLRKLYNLLNLDHPDKDLLESVRDAHGKVVAENFNSKEKLEDLDTGRMYGRSRNAKDLREMLKTNKTFGKFIVLKIRKTGNLKSKLDGKPRKVFAETGHTVTVEGEKSVIII